MKFKGIWPFLEATPDITPTGTLPQHTAVTGEFRHQMVTNAENDSFHGTIMLWDTLLIGPPSVCHYGSTDNVSTETSRSHFHSSRPPTPLRTQVLVSSMVAYYRQDTRNLWITIISDILCHSYGLLGAQHLTHWVSDTFLYI